jgi:hypothetical protein
MKRRGGPSDRLERKQTAAVEQATGQFYCSSSAHMATGTPVIIRGRKVCQACADQRKKVLKEKARG